MTTIHPLAIVSKDAQLGEGVSVGAFATVEAGATLGDGCVVRERAHVCTGAVLGKNCILHMNAVVGHVPQDLSYKGEPLRTTLGDGVTVRENATIHGSPRGAGTRVGDNCYLMVASHIAHDCVLGSGVILAGGSLLAGHIQVEDNAFISGNVTVHQFVRIGRLSMCAGAARVAMDVPPYMIADGINAVTVLNTVGLRRSPAISEEERKELKAAYKIVYRSGLSLNDALQRLEAEFATDAVKHWVAFFRAPTKRGLSRNIMGGRRAGE